jgi:3-hydroxyisobutyrate dehydrogenase
MIAFYGMGLLGSNFVRAMRKRGEEVHVWSRTLEKARALEAVGAKVFDDPAAAARGASRVHLALSDDAAVDAVLEKARAGFGDETIIVDHTTTSPHGAAERAKRFRFLHAPVFMGPPNALDATGVMMASGERARYDAVASELAKMTGKVVYLGEAPDRAATFKLMGNAFLMALTGGLTDVLTIAKTGDVAPAEALAMFDWFNPGATLPARAKRMLDAPSSAASWELTMARKDARLMIDEASRAKLPLVVVPGVAAAMDRFIERGHGKDDWTIIAKDVV